MPRRPVGATCLPVVHGTQNRQQRIGGRHFHDTYLPSRSLRTICSSWGICSGRFSSPRREYTTLLEPNDRTLSTVGACVEQGFGPRTVRAATMSPTYWGRPEGNLAQAYQTAFECQVEWNGKVSERYAHLRIWGSQVMRVTVDRTQATVPVRHC
jgi:hypothetical protein